MVNVWSFPIYLERAAKAAMQKQTMLMAKIAADWLNHGHVLVILGDFASMCCRRPSVEVAS